MSHDLRDPLPLHGEWVDLDVMESAVMNEDVPQRPHVTRLVASRMTDAEQAADFKHRLVAALSLVAGLKDEMKAAGNYDFNFQWGTDAYGRSVVGGIVVFKAYI